MKVRANLSITHIGPETLEEAVQDYVNRNCDLYDLPGMVSVSNICLCLCYRKRSPLQSWLSVSIRQKFGQI